MQQALAINSLCRHGHHCADSPWRSAGKALHFSSLRTRLNDLATFLQQAVELREALRSIRTAALDASPVSGLTHQHYKYPARFSPRFARAAIASFSLQGDLVLDPYMGGGTTVVEAIAADRRAVGCDINSLAVFVAKAKTTPLSEAGVHEVEAWLLGALQYGYRDDPGLVQEYFCKERTKNLHLPRARALKKFIAFCLASCDALESADARVFTRCALLNVTQWALNGRRRPASLEEFRRRLEEKTFEMIAGSSALPTPRIQPHLVHASAEHLPDSEPFTSGALVDLVVTSPPYPGIHVLYHRWQVDGRRETPAPYWIADCLDGQGSAYYNFGSRKQTGHDDYFEESLRTLRSIRRVMRPGAVMVQMIAFADARHQLPRYLANMDAAGFGEVRNDAVGMRRIWRQVPRRSWHADLQGRTGGAREVVLIHVAI
jgi:SAM-dependent methyltransferase